MKVHWCVPFCCAVLFIGWSLADEENRRKLIIHLPHHHTVHKHSTRQAPKFHSHHGKGHGKEGDHIHKHHHHFHDDEYGGATHGSEEAPHFSRPHHHHDHPQHHHHPPPHYHHSSKKHRGHHHHSHSGHHHSHPSHHHHDHHGHGSHHVSHIRNADHHHHHDEDDFNPRFRAEESKYSSKHHYSDHSYHRKRPLYYEELEDEAEYDCTEVCEKCKMKYYKRYQIDHDIMRTESENSPSHSHPQLTVAHFKSPPPSNIGHGNYGIVGKEDFKPSLAAGELNDSPTGFHGSKYGSYVLPSALEQMTVPNSAKVNTANSPLRHEQVPIEYDASFPSYSEFLPAGNWHNNSFYYGNFQEPGANIAGYNNQREKLHNTHYSGEETRQVGNKNNDERGRDIRYLNRYKYNINR